ncbi:MAG: ABC transporter permease [Ruminococcus sp.]|nr:ABC transporter permease [Ruminococcus sp.]
MKNMKKTALRDIKGSLGRFMAILAIIALGVGFFSGVKVTTPAMVSMMGDFVNKNNLYDYRIISTLGWDKDSVAEFANQDDVKYAEGGYGLDVIYVDQNDNEFVIKTHNISENVNGLLLQEGHMPENPNECVVMAHGGFKTGDTFKISSKNSEDTVSSFTEKEFTVVGRVDSSDYVNYKIGNTSVGNGSFDGFIYVMESAFDIDYFTDIYIKFNQDYQIYSDDYDDFIESKSDLWEDIAQQQADLHYKRIIDDAQAEIDDAKYELDDERTKALKEFDDAKVRLENAKTELDDVLDELRNAKKEIDDGKKKLSDAKTEIDNGKYELAEAEKTLENSKITLDESEQKLIDGENQLADGQTKLDRAWEDFYAGEAEYNLQETDFYTQYGDAIAMIDYLPSEQQEMLRSGIFQLEQAKLQIDYARAELEYQQSVLNSSREEIESDRTEFEQGKAQYEQGLADCEKAKSELEKAEKEYKDGLKEIEDAEKKYNEGNDNYASGHSVYTDNYDEYATNMADFEREIADAEKDIAEAEQKIADIEKPEIYLLDRDMNIGYATFRNDSEIVEQVAKVFPIFFILVAALVCMTTMSRMVEEQRTEIGMFKALGYSESAIMGKFMLYSGSASLIGCILGFFAGTYSFPAIIWLTYKLMYVPLDIPYLFDKTLFIASVGASLLCSLGMTWISCRVELAETAANLMRPKAPKAGKRVLPERIPFIWNRLKFLHKVSLRNIFRYKGRFFMMIIGIGGCTALLLTGFGLKDSVAKFADVQYDEIQITDAIVNYEPENAKKVQRTLAEKADSFLLYRESSWDLICDSGVKSISLETVESFDNMPEFMNFHTEDGVNLEYPQLNEALICHSISDRYGVKQGDKIMLRDPDMNEMHLKVTGVFENHVYNYIYISKETYKSQLGEDAEMNSSFMNFRDSDNTDTIITELLENADISYISVLEDTKASMADKMSSLDYVVLLVIVCAAGLAFIVIYNLTNINITERTREIATIKVLGFFRNETSAYVLRENIVLTSLGILCGLGLGILLHRFVMAQIVVDMIEFSIRILPLSYVLSIILTFVFNFIVNIFMQIKLEKINMAESLKSVD